MSASHDFVRISGPDSSLFQATLRNYRKPWSVGFWKTVASFFPILSWLPTYQSSWFWGDLVGGLTVGILNVPQGIAYALLAELPPVSGLYVSLLSGALFPLFTSWPNGSLGPFAVVELMCGAVVRRLQEDRGDEWSSGEIVSMLTFCIGLCHVLLALLRITFVTAYFSESLVQGFVTGAAIHVTVAQMDTFLGITKVRKSGTAYLFKSIFSIAKRVPEANKVTVLLGIASLAFLFMGKLLVNQWLSKLAKKTIIIPFELVLVIIVTALSYSIDLNGRYSVNVVGEVPRGLPAPSVPNIALMPELIADVLAICVVMVAVHLSIAKVMCSRHGYQVDNNQEIYAAGFVALISSFFPVFPAANGLGRPLLLAECGSRTQMANFVTSFFVFIVLMLFAPFFYWLPLCVLSAIILVALRSILLNFTKVPQIWRLSRTDFCVWMVAFWSTICIDVTGGLLFSLCFQFFLVSLRMQWPEWSASFSRRKHGLDFCVFRFGSMLIFNNCRLFQRSVSETMAKWNKHGLGLCPRVFVFDFCATPVVDSAGLDALNNALEKVGQSACSAVFANVTESVRDQIMAVNTAIGSDAFYDSVEEALSQFRTTNVDDSEDSPTNPFEKFTFTTKL